MRHRFVVSIALAAMTTGAIGVLRAQQILVAPDQILQGGRDPAANQVRLVPIGTGAISGVVMAADTGRPIRRARLSLNGASSVTSPGRGGTPGAGGVLSGRDGGPGLQTGSLTPGGPSGMGLTRSAISDDQGRFSFASLPAGRFTLTVTRDQFLAANYGQKKPGRPGTPIDLLDGQRADIKVQMVRGGVISGLVLDDTGEPLSSTEVRALRYSLQGGFKRLQQSRSVQTDDRGMYRLFGLDPGDYVVSVRPNSGDMMQAERMVAEAAAFDQALAAQRSGSAAPTTINVPLQIGQNGIVSGMAPTYYPAASAPKSATTVTIGAGEERSGIDIRTLPIRAGALTGMVTGIPPGVAVQIMLQNADPTAEANSQGARAMNDGRFNMSNLPPGDYVLTAQTVVQPPQPIVTNGAVAMPPQPVNVTLDASQRLFGRATVTIDGVTTPNVTIALPTRAVHLGPRRRGPDAGRHAEGTRERHAHDGARGGDGVDRWVAPGGRRRRWHVHHRRRRSRTLPAACVGAGHDHQVGGGGRRGHARFSARDDGDRDISNAIVTLSDRITTLTGTLTDATGKLAPDYTIVLAPSDPRFWTPGSRRILTSTPAAGGRFDFRGLPAGQVLLAAVTDVEPGGQYDPDFLKQVQSAAVQVSLADGQTQQQNLRLGQ